MGIWRTLAIGAAVVVGGGALVNAVSDDPIVVEKIIDGDTIDVRQNGETTRIRLLNVDTPEIGRDGKPSECLAQEARDYLADLLGVGTEVTLEYDVERTDKYGRTLAGVYKEDSLVNAEVAREGLGVAVDIAPNHKFYPKVSAAEAEAEARTAGIFALGPECMVDDSEFTDSFEQAQAAINAAEDFQASNLAVAADYTRAREHSSAVDEAVLALATLKATQISQSEFQTEAYGTRFKELIDDEETRAEREANRLTRAIENEDDRRAEVEAEREEEALRRAVAELEPNILEEEPSLEALKQPVPAPALAPDPAPAAPAADKYTGCRAYGGNYAMNSVDDQGRPYAKIDCTTKAQIG
ncbi:thermonuclease family protein [Corynebacterium lubricantis]|uniref:thermonuclease family protein n=1 Tax=Corynebacterium lubricantis TaxID=541095 RepID=UPI00035EC9D5|nr:thermonuclease family protein [Corynebacterium lubricantis]